MTTKVASSPALQLAAACDKTSREATFAELLTAAQAAFGVEFSLLDGNSGEVLQLAADHARLDWTLRGELCREVARRGSAEVIEDDDPLAILALPLAAADGATFVAVGTFLTRPVTADESPAGLERARWAAAVRSWPPGLPANAPGSRNSSCGSRDCSRANSPPSGNRPSGPGKSPACRATCLRPTKKSACSINSLRT